MRQVLDTHFPLEGDALAADTHRAAGWQPACGRGWWPVGAYGADAEMSEAYQDWCLTSAFSPAAPLHHALTAYALASSSLGAQKPLGEGSEKNKEVGGKGLAVVDGVAGAGYASASLAVWARHFEDAQPHVTVLYHRIGACAAGGGATRPVERELVVVMAQLKARLGLAAELPRLSQVKEQWHVWLDMAAARQPVLIVLDGLERLSEAGGALARELWEWMPTRLHGNCSVFLGVGDMRSTGFAALVHPPAASQTPGAALSDGEIGEGADLCYVLAHEATQEHVKQVMDDAAARSSSSLAGLGARQDDARQKQEQDDARQEQEQDQDASDCIQPQHHALVQSALAVQGLERALGVMLFAKVLMHDAELVLTTGSAEAQPAPGAQDGAAVPSASVSASLQRRGSLKISGHHGRAAEGGETSVAHCGQLMLRVLQHRLLKLRWLASLPSLWPLLELIASSYMGVTESVLLQLVEQALQQDTPHPPPAMPHILAFALLRALRPYIWSGAARVHGGEVLAEGMSEWKGVPISKRPLYSHLQPPPPGSPLHLPLPVALIYMPEWVSETIWAWNSSSDETRLSDFVCNVEVLLAAYHSEYWRDYTAAWTRLASSLQKRQQLAINLRISAQSYAQVLATDGLSLAAGSLHHHLRLAHLLLVVRFLSTEADAAEQAHKLLEHVAAAQPSAQADGAQGTSAESPPYAHMPVAVALHAAQVHARQGQPEAAISDLSHLSLILHAPQVQQAPEDDRRHAPGAAYWREWAYVQGFCRDCTAAGLQLLGHLQHEACQLTVAMAACSSHLERLEAEPNASKGLQLMKAHSLWRLARVQSDLAMHTQALHNTSEALAIMSSHLSPLDHDLKHLGAWAAQIQSKLKRTAAGADADGKELARIMDLHLEEEAPAQELDNELDNHPGPQLSEVPELLHEFDTLFWQQQYVAAHGKVRRVLKVLQHETPANKALWVDASLKWSRVLMRLGCYDEAIQHLRLVLQLEQQHDTAAEHLHVVGPSIELACHLIEKGEYEQGQKVLGRLPASELQARLDRRHPVVCRLMYAQASLLAVQGFFDQALSQLRGAEAGQKERLVAGDTLYTQLLDTRLRIVEVLHAKRQHAEAEAESNVLQLELEKLFGKRSIEAAHLHYMAGCRMLDQADYRGADTVMRDVSRIVSTLAGSTRGMHHPLLLSATAKIAEIGEQQGRYSESDHIYLKTLDALAASHLDLHSSLCVAQIREGYSKLQLPQGRPQAALDLLLQGFDARSLIPARAPAALFSSYVMQALQQIALGRLTDARDSLDKLCSMQHEDNGELATVQEADVAYVQGMLALQVKEDLTYSQERMRHSLHLRQAQLAPQHPLVALTELDLAGVMLEQHRLEESEALLVQVSNKLTEVYGKNSRHLARVKRLRARVCLQRGAYVEGEAFVREALANDASPVWLQEFVGSGFLKPVSGADKTPAVLENLELLARFSFFQGRIGHAEILVRQCEGVAREVYGSMQHPVIARCLVALALIRLHDGNRVEAHRMLQQGLELQEKMLGGSHPDVIMTQLEMIQMFQAVGDVPAALERCTQLRSTLLSLGRHTSLQVMWSKPCEARAGVAVLTRLLALVAVPYSSPLPYSSSVPTPRLLWPCTRESGHTRTRACILQHASFPSPLHGWQRRVSANTPFLGAGYS